MKWTYSVPTDRDPWAVSSRGVASDCVVRAITLATELPYMEVAALINKYGSVERVTRKKRGKSSHTSGVYKRTIRRILSELGWTWTPTMGIGTGCKVHLRDGELPMGRLVVSVTHHMTAVLDGVIHDTHDPSRNGNRCVYGYWSAPEREELNGK